MPFILGGILLIILIIWLAPAIPVSPLGALLIVIFGFFFSTVSARMVGMIGGIFFKTILVPVLCIAAHYLFRFLGQHDPDFLGVFWRSKDYRPYYYP